MSDFRFPSGCITNREVSNSDGNQITQDKLYHLTKYTERFQLEYNGNVADKTYILFQADKAGELGPDISAACYADGTTGSVTFDLKKNGSTILSAVITVNSSTGDRVQVAGSFTSDAARAYAVGDVFTVVMDQVSSGDQTGPMLSYQRIEQGD